jgi:signal transduction histidine kinase
MAQQNIQEFTIQRPNGERCTIQNVLSRIKGKGGFMMSSFSRDITESARLEQMKSDFINRAAHDLRTPLTTVTMMVDLIQEGGEENELKQYWLILNTELKRQQSLIEELLMIGRLESGRFTLQAKPLKLAPVLDESIQATLPLADNKSIEFNYFIAAGLPIINANEASLQEVFVNLLNNAIKFTPVGGKVELNAVVQGNGVMVCVSDNGMGIPEEDLPQLFTRFFRGGNAIYNEIPGSGVGLYIVKSIVELLGGSIHVQSKINCGTTFQIWLPALKY